MERTYHNVINFFEKKENLSLSLFNSEGFYWLTTATAIAFAAEELLKFQREFPELFSEGITPLKSEPFINLFKESIKQGETTEEIKKEAQRSALYNLEILNSFSKNSSCFKPLTGLILGKTFATYWLMYKLIELEWQQILNFEETQENYLLLDTVILDHEELEQLEEVCIKGDITQDNKIYLRSHWERVRHFWSNLQEDLTLLADGYVSFTPPYKSAQ
ncbi:MAG: hypothetical protein ACOYVD_14555 [Bacillota bacterium]